MAKPLPQRVNSDDCEVVVNGETCKPHEGEWVELFRVQTFADWAANVDLRFPSAELDDAAGEPDETERTLKAVRNWYAAVTEVLAEHVTAWSWTDARGRALPPPSLSVLRKLSMAEIRYLHRIQQDESPAEGKAA